jgi:uncharacterized protein YjhX (UPF0386 family)
MAKIKFTDKQKRILKRLAEGAKIRAYTPSHGRQCFESDEDGLKATLYLTLTMRALRDKGAVLCLDNCNCIITETGLKAAGLINPIED